MNLVKLRETLQRDPAPAVVEFWAPWCAPCRMMAPALERAAADYAGRVTLVKINADEHPELVRELRVMAIPAMVIFQNGQEVHRRVGAQPPHALNELFARLAEGGLDDPGAFPAAGMSPLTRALRLGGGLALLALGFAQSSWLLLLGGGLIMFWGWYDRCPIWQAFYPRVKTLFSGKQ